VITPESRARIESMVEWAVREGARTVVDGRRARVEGYAEGNFVRPTLLEDLPLTSEIAGTEIFGPVLSLHHVEDIDAAFRW
jgi:malonate-semialdehyde dehydrogenase (acetylating)/methylmalonate-semialdehyde dehydrogenase